VDYFIVIYVLGWALSIWDRFSTYLGMRRERAGRTDFMCGNHAGGRIFVRGIWGVIPAFWRLSFYPLESGFDGRIWSMRTCIGLVRLPFLVALYIDERQ